MRSYFPHASSTQLVAFGGLVAVAVVLGLDLAVAFHHNIEISVLRAVVTMGAIIGAAWCHEKLTAPAADRPYDWSVDGI